MMISFECDEYLTNPLTQGYTEENDLNAIPIGSTFLSQLTILTYLADIEIISREDWGAQEPTRPYRPHNPSFITIHHTLTPNEDSLTGAERVRQIQEYHMDEKGFTDIGYHYVVCKDGKIYEGRPVEVVGAHVKGHNIGNIGIGVIGDYNSAELSDAQENALISLIKSLRKKFGIEGDSIYGHRDFGLKRPKDCPGDNLYNKLPEIREKSLPDSQH